MSQWNLIAGLKKFDAYPKTLEDFRIQTRSGKIKETIQPFIIVLDSIGPGYY
jgi:hypothetical protein